MSDGCSKKDDPWLSLCVAVIKSHHEASRGRGIGSEKDLKQNASQHACLLQVLLVIMQKCELFCFILDRFAQVLLALSSHQACSGQNL